MDDVLENLLMQYKRIFGEEPPLKEMKKYTEREIVYFLSRCIAIRKDIFELGYIKRG